MKRSVYLAAAALSALLLGGCKQKPAPIAVAKIVTSADLAAMANAVPNTGPRDGNNYKVFMLILRQDQSPAVNFKVDAWVKGKGEPVTRRTDESGLVVFDSLPFPSQKQPLNAVLHYYKGAEDAPREITYPFLETDAYRLKDLQYIPNTVTPDPEP